MPALTLPSADSVLHAIYQHDADGAASYEIDDGATVSYWYSYEFDLKASHYFTGFASKTNGRPEEGSEYDLPDGKVAISQATFVRTDGDGQVKWARVATDGYVGEFGRNDRAEEIDSSRKTQSHGTADGRLLLAVPTRDFINGSETRAFALFLFDPDGMDQAPYRKWAYVGSIPAGEDNSAACDDGTVMPCVSSIGALSFQPPSDGGLPRLKVSFSGTAISAPGRTRPLRKADSVTYSFDRGTGSYRP